MICKIIHSSNIISGAGTLTCSKYPGSLGYEETDAAQWASWGIDCE
jgi:alpha-galactosidase